MQHVVQYSYIPASIFLRVYSGVYIIKLLSIKIAYLCVSISFESSCYILVKKKII